MFYKNILFITVFLILTNCSTVTLVENKPSLVMVNAYSNKGFALIYNDNLYKKKIVSKKISERSLIIFQKNLKTNTQVKITNILNNKSITYSFLNDQGMIIFDLKKDYKLIGIELNEDDKQINKQLVLDLTSRKVIIDKTKVIIDLYKSVINPTD